jgi:hypothetical protein
MACLPRLYFPGYAHHVIQRGNNREACFYGEEDYKDCPFSSGRPVNIRSPFMPLC